LDRRTRIFYLQERTEIMANTLPEPAICRAGCAQQVITPPIGVSLAGYFHDRISRYVRDDLYARTIVIESGGTRLAMVSYDLISVADEKQGPFEKYLIKRAESWPYDGQNADVPVQAMRIGDIALVGLPAEIFVRIGLEIKHFSPAPFTFVVELANARSSTYVPTTDQAERGAYGAKPALSRWLCADAGRRMADAALVMLHQLWA
jgi:neutral ceramidase